MSRVFRPKTWSLSKSVMSPRLPTKRSAVSICEEDVDDDWDGGGEGSLLMLELFNGEENSEQLLAAEGQDVSVSLLPTSDKQDAFDRDDNACEDSPGGGTRKPTAEAGDAVSFLPSPARPKGDEEQNGANDFVDSDVWGMCACRALMASVLPKLRSTARDGIEGGKEGAVRASVRTRVCDVTFRMRSITWSWLIPIILFPLTSTSIIPGDMPPCLAARESSATPTTVKPSAVGTRRASSRGDVWLIGSGSIHWNAIPAACPACTKTSE